MPYDGINEGFGDEPRPWQQETIADPEGVVVDESGLLVVPQDVKDAYLMLLGIGNDWSAAVDSGNNGLARSYEMTAEEILKKHPDLAPRREVEGTT